MEEVNDAIEHLARVADLEEQWEIRRAALEEIDSRLREHQRTLEENMAERRMIHEETMSELGRLEGDLQRMRMENRTLAEGISIQARADGTSQLFERHIEGFLDRSDSFYSLGVTLRDTGVIAGQAICSCGMDMEQMIVDLIEGVLNEENSGGD